MALITMRRKGSVQLASIDDSSIGESENVSRQLDAMLCHDLGQVLFRLIVMHIECDHVRECSTIEIECEQGCK